MSTGASQYCCLKFGCGNPEFCDLLGKSCGDPTITEEDINRVFAAMVPCEGGCDCDERDWRLLRK
jgi:hypothetical protein